MSMTVRRGVGAAVCAAGIVGMVAVTVYAAYADNGMTDQQILDQCGLTPQPAGDEFGKDTTFTCSFVQTQRTDGTESAEITGTPFDPPGTGDNGNCTHHARDAPVRQLWLWSPGWYQTSGPWLIPDAAVQVFDNSQAVSAIRLNGIAPVHATVRLDPGQWAEVYEQSHWTQVEGHWQLSVGPAAAGPWSTSVAAFKVDNVATPNLKTVNATKRQMTNAEYRVWCGQNLPAPVGVPAVSTAVAGNKKVTVSVSAPTAGGPVDFETVTASPGGRSCTISHGSGSCPVTGLATDRAYRFTATATNASGTSAASAASRAVTPTSAPSVPRQVRAVAGDTQVFVSWDASIPYPDTYTVTATPGGHTCLVNIRLAERITCPVTGLTNGVAYTFRVTATNHAGSSSAVSNKATPKAM
jgi:hypothetical protein